MQMMMMYDECTIYGLMNDVCSNYRTVNIVFVCVNSKRETKKKEEKEKKTHFENRLKLKRLLAYRNFILIF